MDGGTPQDLYARSMLAAKCGYPLWEPQLLSKIDELPDEYKQDGIQIGDVGVVDSVRGFDVVFNVCKSADYSLHERWKKKHLELPEFQPISPLKVGQIHVKRNAEPPGTITFHGAERIRSPSCQTIRYEFAPSSSLEGAVLVLPDGAVFHESNFHDPFRDLAIRHAYDWYQFAGRCLERPIDNNSLYLVTGFYKACSYSLTSFKKPDHAGASGDPPRVWLEKANDGNYAWGSTFTINSKGHSGTEGNKNVNKCVFLRGFKITLKDQLFLGLATQHVTDLVADRRLGTRLIIKWLRWLFRRKKTHLTHVLTRSQPFHPSDTMNRYSLNKRPDMNVAVTHDSEWIAFIEKEQTSSDVLIRESDFMQFLSEKCSVDPQRGAVYVGDKDEGAAAGISELRTQTVNDITSIPGEQRAQCYVAVQSSNGDWKTNEDIRAEDITVGLGRVPVGFYIRIESCGGMFGQTKNKSAPLYDRIIQWDDHIYLPSDPSTPVRLIVCASFEFTPMLGRGEPLRVLETSVGDLLHRAEPFIFSDKEGETASPCSSLFVAVQQLQCPMPDPGQSGSDPDHEGHSVPAEVTEETEAGHDVLRHYNKHRNEDDLKSSIAHFERALTYCADKRSCRAATLSNLARVEFLAYQTLGTYTAFESSISHYREALDLRTGDHRDRPLTLVQLSRVLLYHYRRVGFETPTEDKIRHLVDELKPICRDDTHECRAAELVIQTFDYLRLRDTDNLDSLNELISTMDTAARKPPDSCFDKPARYNNLGLALLRRFQLKGNDSDLDEAIRWLDRTVHDTPNSDPDAPTYLSDLGAAFLVRFQQQCAVPLTKQL